MSVLLIRLSKKTDGSTVLSCTRPDGSQTWQRHQRHATFFPLHDLMHFAVESTLNLRYGFYGLLASGWAITDFGERTLPPYAAADAIFAETAVGLLFGEQATGDRYDVVGFNETLVASMAEGKHAVERRVMKDELESIRRLWQELVARWAAVAPGGEMALSFERAPAEL